MGWLYLPRREESGPRPFLDWIGATVLFVAIFTMLAALANGQRWGWENAAILRLEAISVASTIFFIWWEPRQPRPILDLRIFGNRAFLVGSVVMLMFGGAFYGVMYLLPQFMDAVLHYSPITSGMLFTPSTVVLAILVPLVGHFSDRLKPHWLTLPGLAFAAWAVFRMAEADWNTSFSSLALSMALLSVAMAAVPPPTLSRAISALPGHLIGYGSGAINFALQLGGAFGTVLLVAILDRRTLYHSDHLTAQLNPGNEMAMHTLEKLGQVVARTGTSDVYQQAAAQHVLSGFDRIWAVIYAYQNGFLIVAIALLSVAVPSYLLSHWGEPDRA